MTGFTPQRIEIGRIKPLPIPFDFTIDVPEGGTVVEVRFEYDRPHTRREWFGCPDCWQKIKPGPTAVVTVDETPATATTTGGV